MMAPEVHPGMEAALVCAGVPQGCCRLDGGGGAPCGGAQVADGEHTLEGGRGVVRGSSTHCRSPTQRPLLPPPTPSTKTE
ncbi:hypothetical protein MRX96_024356 [Rhipicephalus microplus]